MTNYKEKVLLTCVILLCFTHLFHSEDKLIKKELQSFIGKVDAHLLKAVCHEILQE